MRGPVFPVLFICLGISGTVLACLLLMPFAKALQARRGYSDQFVTDLAVALPLGAFILVVIVGMMLLAD